MVMELEREALLTKYNMLVNLSNVFMTSVSLMVYQQRIMKIKFRKVKLKISII